MEADRRPYIEDSSFIKGPSPLPCKFEVYDITLRVQVRNNKVSTPNHNYDSYYENPKYPMVRYFGPLGLQL